MDDSRKRVESPDVDDREAVEHVAQSTDDRPDSSSPQAPDGGWGWVVVICSFFVSVIVDGICNTFGIVKSDLDERFEVSDSTISSSTTALVGSLLSGVYMLAGPIAGALANKFGCRVVCIAGSVLAGFFIFISGFSVNVEMLLVTYGVIGGIGFGLMYLPAIVMVGYYFDKRRALAVGIAVCGTGVGTVVLAPLVSLLVEQFTWRGANVILGGIVLNGIVLGAFYRPLKIQVEIPVEEPHIINTLANEKRLQSFTIDDLTVVGNCDDDVDDVPWLAGMFENREPPSGIDQEAVPLVVDDNEPRSRSRQTSSIQMRSRHVTSENETNAAVHHSRTTVNSGDACTDVVSNARSRHTSVRQPRSRHTSTRSVTIVEEKKPFDRQDALVASSLTATREFKDCGGDFTTYIGSVSNIRSQHSVAESFSPLAIIKNMFDVSLLKSPTVLLLCASGFFSFAGFYTPFVYVPAKSESLGESPQRTSLLLSVMGATNTVFRIVAGVLADHPRVDTVVFHNVAILLAGVVTCLVCVFNSWELLMMYAALFGMFTAAFVTLRSVVVIELLGISKLNNAFGLMCLVQGLAAMIGSPISGAMYDATKSYNLPFIVSGLLFALSGIVCLPIKCVADWEQSSRRRTADVTETTA